MACINLVPSLLDLPVLARFASYLPGLMARRRYALLLKILFDTSFQTVVFGLYYALAALTLTRLPAVKSYRRHVALAKSEPSAEAGGADCQADDSCVGFEFVGSRALDLGSDGGRMTMIGINDGLARAAGARGLHIVGWAGVPTLRVRCQASHLTREQLWTDLQSGRLDALTGERWETMSRDDDAADLVAPSQTPLAMSEDYDQPGATGVVCHRDYIIGMETEAAEAEAFVGSRTQDLADVRVYVTRKRVLPFVPIYQIYAHSNFVKRNMNCSTKISVTGKISLLTLLRNMTCLYMPSESELDELDEMHRDRVQYIVNERMLPKGDAAFFCGATNVRFVYVKPGPWKDRVHDFAAIALLIATQFAAALMQPFAKLRRGRRDS